MITPFTLFPALIPRVFEKNHITLQKLQIEKEGCKSGCTSPNDYFWPQENERRKLRLKIENKSNILKVLAACVALY